MDLLKKKKYLHISIITHETVRSDLGEQLITWWRTWTFTSHSEHDPWRPLGDLGQHFHCIVTGLVHCKHGIDSWARSQLSRRARYPEINWWAGTLCSFLVQISGLMHSKMPCHTETGNFSSCVLFFKGSCFCNSEHTKLVAECWKK